MSSIIEEKENRERLLRNVKKECKQLMEIAVTKKFINEDNSCITTLCATIESCLLHGLRRRAIGLFKRNTTLFVLQKISKSCEQAKQILDLCDEYEIAYCSKNSINENKVLHSANSQQSLFSRKNVSDNSNKLINGRNFSPIFSKGSNCYRFLWIRIALLNKCLIKIIDHLIEVSDSFYYSYALLADPVDGPIFSSLLIGPCALEYTQMKSCEHIWNDPNADELVQRHRMHSSANNSFNNVYGIIYNQTGAHLSNSTANLFNRYKLGLNSSFAKRKASISTALDDITNSTNDKFFAAQTNTSSYHTSKEGNQTSPQSNSSFNYSAKEYVESLHQNSKSQIIYGKNHVIVIQREKDITGYLSLHLTSSGMVLKWTPNQIMNGCNSFDETSMIKTKTGYWDYALNIDFNTIVNLHCHQQSSAGATIVLVAQDGVQYPPIIFPKGSHLLQFLTCLETGLAPNGQLDPALWNDDGKGKIFPKIPRKTIKKYKSETLNKTQSENLEEMEDSQEDFVFRIINSKANVTMVHSEPVNKQKLEFSLSVNEKSDLSQKTLLLDQISCNKSKLGFFFSTLRRKNSSLDEFQTKHEIKVPSPSLTSQLSVFSSIDSNHCSISSSSIVLDKTSINGFQILSKIENLQHQAINNHEFNPENLAILKQISSRSSLKTLCDNMKKQILCRAFYGWLAYHRHLKTITTHLVDLINLEKEVLGKKSADTEFELDDQGNKINIGEYYLLNKLKLDQTLWNKWIDDDKKENKLPNNKEYFYKIIYLNGIENAIRKQVWPFLLDHFTIEMTVEERRIKNLNNCELYYKLIEEWKPFEELINAKDQKKLVASLNVKNESSTEKLEVNIEDIPAKNDVPMFGLNRKSSVKTSLFGFSLLKKKPKALVTTESLKNEAKSLEKSKNFLRKDSSLSNDVFVENDSAFSFSLSKFSAKSLLNKLMSRNSQDIDTVSSTILGQKKELTDDECRAFAVEIVDNILNKIQSDWEVLYQEEKKQDDDDDSQVDETYKTGSVYADTKNILSNTTSLSIDESFHDVEIGDFDQLNEKIAFFDCESIKDFSDTNKESNDETKKIDFSNDFIGKDLSNQELIENFALNMHRIDKDVTRCDRNYWYFTSNENLLKLKNIMYTFVWENLNIGYIQGMCDLVAPLLVIFDDEPLTYSCFKNLMERMSLNFPHGTAMDEHFSNMRNLIQILDTDLFEHMHHRGDYTHFYFSYRWFLLDFKRELVYDDVFSVWETIWAAKHTSSKHFHLFIALALVETYRDIIIENNMDFTDIIKFFNEMAEKHNIDEILELARNLIRQLQSLIDNKNDIKFD